MSYRNNYKEKGTTDNMIRGNKRGQVSIFIIIAIIIVVGIVLAVVLVPKFRPTTISANSDNPKAFLESCLQDEVTEDLKIVGDGGGYFNPKGTVMDNGIEYKYLCYTNQYYFPCDVQEPFVKDRIESEMTTALKNKIDSCINDLVQESERRGNQVSVGTVSGNVELNPGTVVVNIIAPMTITKDVSRNFDNFKVEYPSKMYDLSMIVTSIISFEATYGDSETTNYIAYYPDLSIDKKQLSDGSTIYKVTDVQTKESISFASRSVAWPPGGEDGK